MVDSVLVVSLRATSATRGFTDDASNLRLQNFKSWQRKAYESTQGRLHRLWTNYEAGDLSTSKLLRAAAKLYAPVDN